MNRDERGRSAGTLRQLRYFKHYLLKVPLLLLSCVLHAGCAVYFHDVETGADHVWGFGHLAMKVAPESEGKQAVMKKTHDRAHSAEDQR